MTRRTFHVRDNVIVEVGVIVTRTFKLCAAVLTHINGRKVSTILPYNLFYLHFSFSCMGGVRDLNPRGQLSQRVYSPPLSATQATPQYKPMVGIEPTTKCLQCTRSTTELHRQVRGGFHIMRTLIRRCAFCSGGYRLSPISGASLLDNPEMTPPGILTPVAKPGVSGLLPRLPTRTIPSAQLATTCTS